MHESMKLEEKTTRLVKNKNNFINVFFLKKNFMAPFCGWGSTASRLEPL